MKRKLTYFKKQFSSVFTREAEGEIRKLDIRTDTCIYNLLVTEEMVRREIVNLNVYKASGSHLNIHHLQVNGIFCQSSDESHNRRKALGI